MINKIRNFLKKNKQQNNNNLTGDAYVTNEQEEQLRNFGISFNRFEKDINLPLPECL